MKVEIDLSTLDDIQLAALHSAYPDLVREEYQRRNTFETLEEGLTALRQAVIDLRQATDGLKATAATRALRDSQIIEIAEKLIGTARYREGMNLG